MFRAEPADFNFDISGHNWFSDEHFWTSLIQHWTLLANSKQAKTMKKAKTSGFFSILMLKRREIENFTITLNRLFWKILKMWFFRDLHFLLIPCQKTSYENKKSEKYQNTSCNREKNFTVNFDVFTVFLSEHVKSQRQQCSWLDQKKSVMFRAESLFFRNDAEKISYFQSWFSIVQNSWVNSTEQNNVSGFIT